MWIRAARVREVPASLFELHQQKMATHLSRMYYSFSHEDFKSFVIDVRSMAGACALFDEDHFSSKRAKFIDMLKDPKRALGAERILKEIERDELKFGNPTIELNGSVRDKLTFNLIAGPIRGILCVFELVLDCEILMSNLVRRIKDSVLQRYPDAKFEDET
jgi:hypothetical protein